MQQEKQHCMWCRSGDAPHAARLPDGASVTQIAEQDAKDWGYHFFQPGASSPQEIEQAGKWRDAANMHIKPGKRAGDPGNDFEFTSTTMQEYKLAFLAQYTLEWNRYWEDGD